MVWVGISIGGRTDLHIIRNGNLTAQRYAEEILRPHVAPYASEIRGFSPLMCDMAKLYKAAFVEKFLEADTTQHLKLPACSPDLNPIDIQTRRCCKTNAFFYCPRLGDRTSRVVEYSPKAYRKTRRIRPKQVWDSLAVRGLGENAEIKIEIAIR